MKSLPTTDPNNEMLDQISSLQDYADRMVQHGDSLSPEDEFDQATQMRRFLANGEAFHLTQKEMVKLVFDGLLREMRYCGCPSCRCGENQ